MKRRSKNPSRFFLLSLSLALLGLLNSATLQAEEDDSHEAPTASATEAPTATAKGESVSAINARDASSGRELTRPQFLVQEIQKLKLSRDAALTLQLLLEKNQDVDPAQFNGLLDVVAQDEKDLLSSEQIRALKDLFRVELTNVKEKRGGELASALKTVVQKLPPPPGANGKGDPKNGVAPGAAAPADPNAKAPNQEQLLKQFSDTLQQTLGDVTNKLLASQQQNAKAQADASKKAALGEKGDADLLKLLRDLEKDKDNKKRGDDRDREDDRETPTPPPQSNAKNDDKDSKKDDSRKDLLDALKDRKKNNNGGQQNNNSGGDKKDDAKKDEKKEEKPSNSSRKRDDDDIKPPKKTPSPTPSPSPTPEEEPPAPPPPQPLPAKLSSLSPLKDRGGDDGRFNFGGAPSGGGGQAGAGARPASPTSFDDSVFNVGNEGGYGGGGDGLRRNYSSSPGYASSGGTGDPEADAGDGTPDEPARATRGGAPTQIVLAPPDEPNNSAITFIGSLSQRICGDETTSVGVCETIKARKNRKAFRDNMLQPAQAAAEQ